MSGSQKTTKHLVVKDRRNKSSPGNPLGTTRGQTTRKTDKFSPGNPLGITRGQTTRKTDKSSPGNPHGITRGQTTRTDKSSSGNPYGIARGIFYHVSDVEGREKVAGEDLIERRRIVDVPTPVVA